MSKYCSRLKAFVLSLFLAALPCAVSNASGESPPLIEIKKAAPNILVEMRYATPDNFTQKTLYPKAVCLLCKPVAERLARVQTRLERENLGLKVWDCYRPLSVQKILWDTVPDPRYVANPKTGSRHNRGTAVDLTLVDAVGRELPMGTGFDEFGPKAHRNYQNLPQHILQNRKTLERAMEAEGFIGLPSEWWHYDDPGWKKFALRDEPLGTPTLMTDKRVAPVFIPAETNQLVFVLSESWEAKEGTLTRYYKVGQEWQIHESPWPVSLGSKGMALGQGLHDHVEKVPLKKEGDDKTPAGIFRIGQAYGYADKVPAGSRWPYQPAGEDWVCVDDPNSPSYNQIFSRKGKKPDWESAEKMKRGDHLYKWVINIEQNYSAVVRGCGSCLFFHLWRREGAPTEGCTAMSEENMLELFNWLAPAAVPVVIQLPKPLYEQVKDYWKLPSL